MKYSPRIVGLLQAAGIVLYVTVFASMVQGISGVDFKLSPMVSMTFFLLAFSMSALICSSIVFLYPIQLFFGERRAEAVKIVLYTAMWLVVFFVVFAAGLLAWIKIFS